VTETSLPLSEMPAFGHAGCRIDTEPAVLPLEQMSGSWHVKCSKFYIRVNDFVVLSYCVSCEHRSMIPIR
jgi:hypothetical protein